jgi:DNA-binding response OmpR family regulator
MLAAMEKLQENEYSAVVINADNFNYIKYLKVIRSLTDASINITAANYDKEEHDEAICNGADIYRIRYDNIEHRVKEFSELVNMYHIYSKYRKKTTTVMKHGDILIKLDTRSVFIKDNEIELKRKEYEILNYFIINKGIVLTYAQVYRQVWGAGYEDNSKEILWNQISQLRRKLHARQGQPGFIKTVHGIGYSLT